MIFPKHSLKIRIATAALLVLLFGSWLLTFYARRELTRDMERVLSEQQFSMASLLADQVDTYLSSRLTQLQSVAHAAETAMRGGGASMQAFIDERPLLQSFFNGGLVAVGRDGVVIAEHPESKQRRGVNYFDYPVVRAAFEARSAAIGSPRLGKHSGRPVVWVAAPILRFDGEAIGVLAGIIDLSLPSPISHIMESRYGKRGGFVLVDVASRTIVTATDKQRALESLPPVGTSPVIDRFLAGHEGSAIFVNPLGVEILSSDIGVPSADWVFAAFMPTEEAFAPIRGVVQRMLWATAALTLALALLLWWLLKRQLAPLDAHLQRISAMAKGDLALVELPAGDVARQDDEIGRLATVFNRLVGTVKARESALLESDQSLHSILAASLDGYWKVGASGRILQVNHRYAELSGYSEAELVGMHISDIDLHHDEQAAAEHVQHIVATGGDQFETEHRRKDGSVWQVEVSAIWTDVDGGQAVSFLRDISERKKAERDLLAAERRFRALVEQSLVGVYYIQDGRFVYVNPCFAGMFGYASTEELLRTAAVGDLVAPEDRGQVAENLQRRTRGEINSLNYEFRGLRRDGTLIDVEVFGATAEFDGRPAVIGVVMDVTERKTAEAVLRNYQETLEATVRERTRELALAKDRAESGNRAKSAFLARMSHELRTPLNHIVGFSLLLKKHLSDPLAHERLASIVDASQALLRLIDDILDYSRTEGEQLVIAEADFDLGELLARARADVSVVAAGKGLELHVEIDAGMPRRLRGDRLRILQVIGHLVGNAVKFSDEGIVSVQARKTVDAVGREWVRIEVEDHGIGIADDQQAALFRLFDQGDGSSTRRFGGTGLGLALCKRLADLMGGTIGCSSMAGKGSRFWFDFPLVAAGHASVVNVEHDPEKRLLLLGRFLELLDQADFESVTLWQDEREIFAQVFGEQTDAVEDALAGFDFARAHDLCVRLVGDEVKELVVASP